MADMADTAGELRVMLELGPKGKRVVAIAPDWPGLERGARTEDAAIARLQDYLPRYAPIAKLAGMEAAFTASAAATATVNVIERYPGVGSTDFWGISFAFSDFDQQPMSREALEHDMALMRACWAFFDGVRARVSAEMQKGPRGGGRDRDRIVRHVLGTEQDWAPKLGLPASEAPLQSAEALQAFRDDYCAAIRAYHAQGKLAGIRPSSAWPLRYLIRHTAYHTLDHAWEMEDKDLTPTHA